MNVSPIYVVYLSDILSHLSLWKVPNVANNFIIIVLTVIFTVRNSLWGASTRQMTTRGNSRSQYNATDKESEWSWDPPEGPLWLASTSGYVSWAHSLKTASMQYLQNLLFPLYQAIICKHTSFKG